MLTVLKDMAAAAEEVSRLEEPVAFAEHVVVEGWASVRRTPSLLKVLADAGVVDAGGFGLVVLVEGLFSAALGGMAHTLHASEYLPAPTAPSGPDLEAEEGDSKYTYCTSFLLQGEGLDAEEFEAELTLFGDSLLVVGDMSQLKVHIHTDEPGEVLNRATVRGILQGIEIDNMHTQTAARDERLREQSQTVGETQVVAVVAGEGNARLFSSLGADLIVQGGQSMNPSAEDLLRAVRKARAASVVILPNNRNIILTAEQIVGLAPERQIFVVPSRSMQAGLSALVAFDGQLPGSENAEYMGEALAGVSAGEVTWAVRDSNVDGHHIREGSYIGLVDGKVVVTSTDLRTAVETVSERLLEGDREVLTVIVGDTKVVDEARAVAEGLRERFHDVEVEVYEGGQPLYPLLLAAE